MAPSHKPKILPSVSDHLEITSSPLLFKCWLVDLKSMVLKMFTHTFLVGYPNCMSKIQLVHNSFQHHPMSFNLLLLVCNAALYIQELKMSWIGIITCNSWVTCISVCIIMCKDLRQALGFWIYACICIFHCRSWLFNADMPGKGDVWSS